MFYNNTIGVYAIKHGGVRLMEKPVLGTWGWLDNHIFGKSPAGADVLKETFDAACEEGLVAWDLAPVYSGGAAESLFGEISEECGRGLFVMTKFTPMLANAMLPEIKKSNKGKNVNYAEETVRKMLDGSLTRLKRDFVDIYWLHHTTGFEQWLAAMIKVSDGHVRGIGISNASLSQVKKAKEMLEAAGLKLAGVQNHFSLLHRKSEINGIMEFCMENGIPFYAYMVLEQGALCDNEGFEDGTERAYAYNKKYAEIVPVREALKETADVYGVTGEEIAVAYALYKNAIPIVGVTKPEHVRSLARAAKLKLKEEDAEKLEAAAEGCGDYTRIWERTV